MVCTVTVYMPSGKGNFNLENFQVPPPLLLYDEKHQPQAITVVGPKTAIPGLQNHEGAN